MTVEEITSHKEGAVKRLLEQYKNKPNLDAVLDIYCAQIQELETEFINMGFNRTINGNESGTIRAEGAQLDLIGQTLDQPRLGFGDDQYRLLLLAKIGQNISNGEPERVIAVFKLLLQAAIVHYQNLGNAELLLGSDGVLDEDFIQFVFDLMERVVAAGVRINGFVFFDVDEPFTFDGPNAESPGLGFGTTGDPLVGGVLATIVRPSVDFAFDGNDLSTGGFGALADPIVGGAFVS